MIKAYLQVLHLIRSFYNNVVMVHYNRTKIRAMGGQYVIMLEYLPRLS